MNRLVFSNYINPEFITCSRCGRNLSLENYFYRPKRANSKFQSFYLDKVEMEMYWYGCKDCYRNYRKELRARKRNRILSIIPDEIILKLNNGIEKYNSSVKDINLPWSKKRELFDVILKTIFPKIEKLGSGVDRTAYAIGDYVIKVSINCLDRDFSNEQSKTEIRDYIYKIKKLSKKIQKYFIPILAYDKNSYNWSIVPKAKTIDTKDLNFTQAEDIIREMLKFFRENNIYIPDLHCKNIGLYNNHPVVIDTGFGISIEGKKDD